MTFRRVAQIVGVLGLLNFISFVVVAQLIGGDALNGHQEAGRYFLANHGQLTEVSREVFMYSKWHAIVMTANWAAMLVCVLLLEVIDRRDRG